MLPGRDRSPRRQQFSWMQPSGGTGVSAGVSAVLPATQLHWSPPNFEVPQQSRLPCVGKGAHAGIGAQCEYGPYRPQAPYGLGCGASSALPGGFQPYGKAMPGKGACVLGQVQQWPTQQHNVSQVQAATPEKEKGQSHSFVSTFGPPLPSSFRGDAMFLDTNLVGGLQLPRFVKTSDFTRRKGIAGCPASAVPIHALLHHGWSSWWLRRLCDGKECYLGMFKDVAEVVFAHSLFQTLRSNHVSLDVIAEHVSRQDGQAGDRTWCSGVLATKVAEYIQSLQPKQSQESDRVAALQSQIQELQKQVAAQQRATQTVQAPSTAPEQRVADQSGAPLDLERHDTTAPGSSSTTDVGKPQEKMQSSLTSFFAKNDTEGGPAASNSPHEANNCGAPVAEPAFGSVEHVQKVMDKPKSEFLSKKWVQMKNDREVKDWISKLKLSKAKSNELQNWIQSVQSWFESLSPGAQAKLDHQAVQWGVPVREISKLKQEPLLKIVAVASKMSL